MRMSSAPVAIGVMTSSLAPQRPSSTPAEGHRNGHECCSGRRPQRNLMSIDQPLHKPLQAVSGKLMGWAQDALLILPNLVVAIVVVGLCWLAARIISTLVKRLAGRVSPNRDVVRLLGFVAYGTLLAGGIFV